MQHSALSVRPPCSLRGVQVVINAFGEKTLSEAKDRLHEAQLTGLLWLLEHCLLLRRLESHWLANVELLAKLTQALWTPHLTAVLQQLPTLRQSLRAMLDDFNNLLGLESLPDGEDALAPDAALSLSDLRKLEKRRADFDRAWQQLYEDSYWAIFRLNYGGNVEDVRTTHRLTALRTALGRLCQHVCKMERLLENCEALPDVSSASRSQNLVWSSPHSGHRGEVNFPSTSSGRFNNGELIVVNHSTSIILIGTGHTYDAPGTVNVSRPIELDDGSNLYGDGMTFEAEQFSFRFPSTSCGDMINLCNVSICNSSFESCSPPPPPPPAGRHRTMRDWLKPVTDAYLTRNEVRRSRGKGRGKKPYDRTW